MAVAKNKGWRKGQSCTSNPSKHKFRGTATGQLGLAAGVRCVSEVLYLGYAGPVLCTLWWTWALSLGNLTPRGLGSKVLIGEYIAGT